MWSFFTRDAAKDFAYELGSEIDKLEDYSVWKLYNGKKKGTNDPVSIFVFEVTSPDSQALLEMAKQSLKRIKTLRHPSILTYIDSYETDKIIYLVVEQIVPLETHLAKNKYTPDQKILAISWGLHLIASGLTFLNKDCQLSHNNINMASVYVNRAGEWRLFGLEYITPIKEMPPAKIFPELKKYSPPELESSKYEECLNWACDSWGLGCLIWEAFNGRLIKSSSLKNTEKIPTSLTPFYCELVCANPKSRPNSIVFIKKASKGNGFFKNKFVETMLFLREIHIKENDEKIRFFNNLTTVLDSFPQDTCLYKILPELVNAFEFGNAGSFVLSPMFKLGKFLNEDEYQKQIVPCVVKMFSSKDRTTRVKLLQQMEEFINHIQPTVVNNQIFPNVAQGFLDTNPAIRDHTIKCMLYLAPKLNYQNLNEEMLKHFARLQTKDEQGGIRTNTTVCLGKIASYLHPQTRKKVLINAFLRALRDPFPPARTAAILALSATENYYSINDCATKVVPALSHFTIDPEKSIRDQAFKAIAGFLFKLEKVSEDPSLIEKMEEELQSTTPSSIAASWTSWAVTSLADKLYKSTSKNQSQPSNQSNQSLTQIKEKESLPEKDAKIKNEIESSTYSWNNEWDDEILVVNDENDKSMNPDKSDSTNDWENEWESFETPNTYEKDKKLSSYFSNDNEDPFTQVKNQEYDVSYNWDDEGNWEPLDSYIKNEIPLKGSDQNIVSKQETNKLLREEKRRQRLKERNLAKPKKLGAQKIS